MLLKIKQKWIISDTIQQFYTWYNFLQDLSALSCSKHHSTAISYSMLLGWEQCEVDIASFCSTKIRLRKKENEPPCCQIISKLGYEFKQELIWPYHLTLCLQSKLVNNMMTIKCRLLLRNARESSKASHEWAIASSKIKYSK